MNGQAAEKFNNEVSLSPKAVLKIQIQFQKTKKQAFTQTAHIQEQEKASAAIPR